MTSSEQILNRQAAGCVMHIYPGLINRYIYTRVVDTRRGRSAERNGVLSN